MAQPKRLRPSLIKFLSDPEVAVAPKVELDLRRGHPDDSAGESKFPTAKELLALTSDRGAVLTEADARAVEESL